MYAHIVGGVVTELFTPPAGVAITDCFNPALVWADITHVSPVPQHGWTAAQVSGVWTFTAPAAPAPTLAQQAGVALTAGVTIALSGSITLAATLFPTDAATQSKLGAVVTALTATGAFPGGATSYPMRDSAGVWHTFTAAQYTKVAGAVAAYVAALFLIVDGNPLSAVALPSASVSLTV